MALLGNNVGSSGKATNFDVDKSEFGVPDPMIYGLGNSKSTLGTSHPLEHSERYYGKNREMLQFELLRRTQGIHAPLKLMMEKKILSKVGRLPFLESSNALVDSLTGKDLEIGFEDFLNIPEFKESMCQPHIVVEKSLGLL